MTSKVDKWNKYMWQQERNFVITNSNIYNFNKKSKKHYIFSAINIKSNLLELRRVIAIQNLAGMTKNLQKASKEFVIHVNQEPDYRVNCA
jgi:hypothetical protein